MSTNHNNAKDALIIYELEKLVCALPDRNGKRRVFMDHVAFYNTVENAEAAMRVYIKEKKEDVGEKMYYDGIMEYHISERQVFNTPNTDIDSCIGWKSFTPDGELIKDYMPKL